MKPLATFLLFFGVTFGALAQTMSGVVAAAPHFDTRNLACWIRFFNPSASQTDCSGNGLTGTVNGSLNFVPPTNNLVCVNPLALRVTSTNDYASVAFDPSASSNAFSVVMWVKPYTIIGGYLADGVDNNGVSTGWYVLLNPDGTITASLTGSALHAAITSVSLASNKWTQLTSTYDASGGIAIYFNGVLEATNATGLYVTRNRNTRINGRWNSLTGSGTGTAASQTNCVFGDFRIYTNRIVSLADMAGFVRGTK